MNRFFACQGIPKTYGRIFAGGSEHLPIRAVCDIHGIAVVLKFEDLFSAERIPNADEVILACGSDLPAIRTENKSDSFTLLRNIFCNE